MHTRPRSPIIVIGLFLSTFFLSAHSYSTFVLAACPSTISFGELIQCSIATPGERDTYSFVANDGDRILVRMTRTSGTFDPEIKILDLQGNEVCGDYDSPIAQIWDCQLAYDGTYTLRAFESFNGTGTGDYTLYLQRLNNPGKAVSTAFGQTLAGSIDPGAEFDTYTFSAVVGDKLFVRMIRTSGTFAPEIKVFDPRGVEVCGNYDSPVAQIYGCEVAYDGTYTLLAFESFRGSNTGNYNLYLQRLKNPGNATSISFGQTLSSSIKVGGEVDTYTFVSTANDKVLVRLARTSGTFETEIKVFDPRGVEICGNYNSPVAQISNCALPYDGIYTILAFESFRQLNTGTYSLYLECLNAPCGPSGVYTDFVYLPMIIKK